MIDEESEIITLFYGEDISEEQSEQIVEYVESKYEDLDVELHYGGQPLYYFFSVGGIS